MRSTACVTTTCPAKINLALSIGSPIPPRGYHPLASWMVALDWGDDLTVARLDGSSASSTYDLAFAPDVPRPMVVDWPLEKDLCVRAHRLLEEHVGQALPVRLTLRKRVPSGGGLGGGSSDAAYTLVTLDELFKLQVERAALIALALRLGSDVPFFVAAAQGRTSTLITGMGEVMEPLPLRRPLALVLIFPPLGTPTGLIYQTFDRLHGYRFDPAATSSAAPMAPGAVPQAQRIRRMAQAEALAADAPFNDLAEPALTAVPELRTHRDRAQAVSPWPVHVTGSGSTLFVLAPDLDAAADLARRITAATGLPARATATL